jgi:hypothetical protein
MAATPSHASAAGSIRPHVQAHSSKHQTPPWHQDAELTKSFLADLTREIAQLPFGAPWPEASPARPECVSYVGELDDLFEIRNWVYACDSPREGAMRTEYYYMLDGSEKPTLERVRYVIVAPPDARVEDWGKIHTAILDDLSTALEIPKWRDRDWEKIGIGRDRVVEEKLFTALPDTGKAPATSSNFKLLRFPVADSTGGWGYNRKQGEVREEMRPIGGGESPKVAQPPEPPRRTRATVESLVVYCFSTKLEAETHEATWDLGTGDTTVTGFPPAVEYGRSEVLRALRTRWPLLASALDSTRATSDQIHVVDSAVSLAHRRRADADKDLILYAAHLWTKRALDGLQENPPKDCNGQENNPFVREFNATFSARDRSQIGCDHDGGWWYTGGFIDSVVLHAGANRWTDYAFLDRTRAGWNQEEGCGYAIGSDEFRPVIARGEAFLLVLARDLVGFLAEIDKHRNFRDQNIGVNWLEQKIDRANLIAARHMRITGVERGQKNDRRMLRAIAPADQLSRLEAIHTRHLNIEQDHGEILAQQEFQRVFAG